MLLTLFAAGLLLMHGLAGAGRAYLELAIQRRRHFRRGTFTTDDAPDANGFYRITGIAGSRNGVTISGLQQTGTAFRATSPIRSTI